MADTAALVDAYTDDCGIIYKPPLPDVVLTTCASIFCAIKRGINALMPCTTPQTLTLKPQIHSFMPVSHAVIASRGPTPALLNNKCTAPKCSKLFSASASTDSNFVTSVT